MLKQVKQGLAVAACVVAPLLGAAGITSKSAVVDDVRMRAATSDPANWIIDGGSFSGEHYSPLDQINIDTVKDLKPAWSFDFDTVRGQEAEPLVVDGVMYVSTAWSKVYALDAQTGRQIWFFDPKVPGETGAKMCCDVVNRGVAIYKGKVYVGALDGRLIALDARSGKVVWTAGTLDPTSNLSITGAPRVMKGKVVIGNGGADFGGRGYVSAYDTETGKMAWRFYLSPGDPAKGPDGVASDSVMETLVRPTWSGDYAKYGAGGTAWDSIAYDQELDQLYIGTGNGSPWNPKYRTDGKGDNLFLCSVVAVNPDTGKYIWHYQENPREAWDYNCTQPMILTDLTIEGRVRKVLLHAPKNGFFYVIDRTSGKVISAKPMVPVTWATGIDLKTGRPVETPNSRYTEGPAHIRPNPSGAHAWKRMAYSPKTGLVYVPIAENGMNIQDDPDFKLERHGLNFGVKFAWSDTDKFALVAWDPVNQKEVWRYPEKGGGALATGGGLVFQGRGAVVGEFAALRADNGKQVWSYKTPNGIQAAPITYMIKGVQYVAIAAGNGASAMESDVDARMPPPGRMLVFRLNGKAKLPPEPQKAPPAKPSDEVFAPEAVTRGGQSYGKLCFRCHGPNGGAANVIPDLRRSPFISNVAGWRAVLVDGALTSQGMVSWKENLTWEQMEEIRAFISTEALKLKKREEAGPVSRDISPAADNKNGVSQF